MTKKILIDCNLTKQNQLEKSALFTSIEAVMSHNRDSEGKDQEKIDIAILPDDSILDIINTINDHWDQYKSSKKWDLIEEEIENYLRSVMLPQNWEKEAGIIYLPNQKPINFKKYNEILKKILDKFEEWQLEKWDNHFIINSKNLKQFLMKDQEIALNFNLEEEPVNHIHDSESKIRDEKMPAPGQVNYYRKEKQISNALKTTNASESSGLVFLISDKDLIFPHKPDQNTSKTALKKESPPEPLPIDPLSDLRREKHADHAKTFKDLDSKNKSETPLYYFRSIHNENGIEIAENVKDLINSKKNKNGHFDFDIVKAANRLEHLKSIHSLIEHAMTQISLYVKEKEAESTSCWRFFTERLQKVNHKDMLVASKALWKTLSQIFKNLDAELGSGIPQPLEIEPLSSEVIQNLLQSTRLQNIPDLIEFCVKKRVPHAAGRSNSGWKTALETLNAGFTKEKEAIKQQKLNSLIECIS